MKINYFRRAGLGLFIITLAAFTIFSSGLNAEAKDEAKNKPSHEIDSYVRYIPSRPVEAIPGEVKIVESGAGYSYEFKAFGKLPVKFSIGNNYIGIENSLNIVELPAHLVGLATDIETTFPFFHFNKTYLRMGVSPSFYADDWDFPASSFRMPQRYFLIYQPDDKWTFFYGAAVFPDFQYEVLPVLGFIYKPNDKLAFNVVPNKPNITYLLNDRLSLFAEGGSSLNKEFEVTRGNAKNVVLRYRQTHLGGGIKYKLNQYIQASISTGGMFNRRIEYRDNQGKVSIKNGMYTEFRVKITS